jgi:hypothetical protein
MDLVLPADRPAVADILRRVDEGERVPPLEHRVVRKDGSTRWVRNTVVPRFEGASVVAYDALVQDVTERRALRKPSRPRRWKHRRLAGASPDFSNARAILAARMESRPPGPIYAGSPGQADLADRCRRQASTGASVITASKQAVARSASTSALVAAAVLRPCWAR